MPVWVTKSVFIADSDTRISAEGMLRNFGTRASFECGELAARWAAKKDPDAEAVWLKIQKEVDRRFLSADYNRSKQYLSTTTISKRHDSQKPKGPPDRRSHMISPDNPAVRNRL